MDDQSLQLRFAVLGKRLRAIEDQLVILSAHAGVPYTPPGAGVSDKVKALADAGKKVDAIREVRAELGVTLQEAQTIVEGL
jgi:ribosomal protein L7/L12